MTTISAKTILRSRNAAAPSQVLSTLLLRYPRCIHSEFMTHRAFSRNAASSRAIPVAKLIQDVLDDPFVPLFWGKNQKGMQAGEEHDRKVTFWITRQYSGLVPLTLTNAQSWLVARDKAVETAMAFNEAGYHKQIVNRLLEPFAHITVLVSSTEWDNFLELRDHPDAEPHIQVLAREIRRELERTDNIQTLQPGEWHLPFVTDLDDTTIIRLQLGEYMLTIRDRIKLSTAHCASTSYKTVDGFDMTLEKAIEIHDKLVGSTPIHASPAEHVAQADSCYWPDEDILWDGDEPSWDNSHQHGNFVGFRQYRNML